MPLDFSFLNKHRRRLCCAIRFLVEKKTKRYMLSHAHPVRRNIEPCRACEEKSKSHIETEAEKQCNSAAELVSFAVL